MRIFRKRRSRYCRQRATRDFRARRRQGYQKAKSHKPDLMLLDVMMTHDSEGFDLARKLKEDPAPGTYPSS